jgi:hypothetical protein
MGCGAAPTPCVVANAFGGPAQGSPGTPYLAIYFPRSGSEQGTCTDPGSDFAGRPHEIYAETYRPTGEEPRDVAWTPDEFAYDVDTGEPPDPSRDPIVRGHFTAPTVDDAGLCTVEGTSAGQQQLGTELIIYEFRRVQLVGIASVQGTELLAEVVVTRGACARTYDVLGIWPPVVCSSETDCNPLPDPEHGRQMGSGLLPSLPVACDTGPILGDGHGSGFCFFPQATPAGFPYLTGR